MANSIFHSTAPFEFPGSGDFDYMNRLVEHLRDQGVAVRALTGFHNEYSVYNHIFRVCGRDHAPTLHLHLRPPSSGMMFTAEGLESFKQRGGRIVCTIHELAKYTKGLYDKDTVQESHEKIESIFERVFHADMIHFVCEDDKRAARSVFSALPAHVIGLIEHAPVTYVLPTIPIEERDEMVTPYIPNNILCFGMLRGGKGLETDVMELAAAMKSRGTEGRIMIVGSICHPDIHVLFSLLNQVYGANIQKLEQLHANPHDFLIFTKEVLAISKLMEALASEGTPACGFSSLSNAQLLRVQEIGYEIYGREAFPTVDITSLRATIQTMTQLGMKPQIPLLPVDIYPNVPEDRLPDLFNQATYAYVPAASGIKSNLTSVANALSAGLIVIGRKTERTPPEFLDQGLIQANKPHAALREIERLNGDPYAQMEACYISKEIARRTVAPEFVAGQMIAIYNKTLGMDVREAAYAAQTR